MITGALSALGCATLAPDAVVHPLLPHDADMVVEGTGADLVLIEASALLPGSPWAYATDPAAADRGRRLARMIVMARSLGKPVVLVRNVPQSLMPGIGWLAAACDAVLDDGFGVQLARFNPVGVTLARPTEPLYAGERDPREAPAVRALLDSLTGSAASSGGAAAAVRLTGARSWRGLPALYREHAVFVTASADQAREQLACGARVVGPLGSGVSADSVRDQVEAARAARPHGLTEIRAGLRDIFAEHATPARLAALVRAAGLPGEPGRRPAGRRARPGHRRRAGRAAGRRAAAPAAAARRGSRRDRRGRPGAGRARRAGRPRDPRRDHGRRLRRWPGLAAPAGPAGQRAVARAVVRAIGGGRRAAGHVPARPGLCPGVRAGGRGRASAPASTSSPTGSTSPPWPVATCSRPEGPRPADWGSHGLRLFTVTRVRSTDKEQPQWPDHDPPRWSTVTST